MTRACSAHSPTAVHHYIGVLQVTPTDGGSRASARLPSAKAGQKSPYVRQQPTTVLSDGTPTPPLSLLSPRTKKPLKQKKVVAFPTDEDAKKATKAWSKGVPFKGRVTSMDPRPAKGPKLKRGSTEALAGFASQVEAAKKAKGKGKKKGGKQGAGGAGGGGAAAAAAAAGGRVGTTARVAPPGTEVLLVVAPKQPELRVRGGFLIFSSFEEAQAVVPGCPVASVVELDAIAAGRFSGGGEGGGGGCRGSNLAIEGTCRHARMPKQWSS